MPCDAHTIFYREYAHVVDCQEDVDESTSVLNISKVIENIGIEKSCHSSPRDLPCNKYIQRTINVQFVNSNAGTALPGE